VRWANAAAERLYGWPTGDVLGLSALALTVAPTETAAAAELLSRLEVGESWTGSFPIRRRDGSRISTWFSVVAVPAPDGSGEPLMVTAAVDLAEVALGATGEAGARAAELRAEQANLLIDALLHSVPVGMAFFDRSGRFVRVNEALAEINGMPPEAHVGRTLAEVLARIPTVVTDTILRVFETGETVGQVEVVGETPKLPGVERHWIVSYFPVRRGDEVLWVGVTAVEVTEWRAAEQERMRLLAGERVARRAAEQAAERLARLQVVTGRLAEAADVATIAEIVVQHGTEGVGAGGGAMCLVDGDELRVIRAAGLQDAAVGRDGRIPLGLDLPATICVRTGEVVLLPSRRARDEQFPALADVVPLNNAFAAVPMSVEGRRLGCILYGWADERSFDDGEPSFLLALARQAAQALERSRLYEAERAARAEAEEAGERMRFLADASRVLSSSLDYDVTLAELARLAVPEVADVCLIHLLEGDELRLVVAAAADRAIEAALARVAGRPAPGSEPRLLGRVAITGETVVIPVVPPDFWDQVARDEEHRQQLAAIGIVSGIVTPLQVQDSVIGVLTLAGLSTGRAYDESDLPFVEDLAGRAAVAIENSRSHRARTEVAQTLQRSLLPPHLPRIPGLELAQRYHSLGDVEVGGDFFDVFPAGDGRWGVVIGDVCGKGVAAAALTALARYTVRAGAIDEGEASEVLRLLNRAILDSDIGERFCTIAYTTVEPVDGGARLILACGGHPLPLLLTRDGEVRAVGVPGSAIGLFEEVELTEVEVVLGEGDALVLFTDGFIEARSPEGAFDPELLARALATAAGRSAEGIAEVVDAAVLAFEAGRQRDDMALLILKVPTRS
jgi:PAS domain S-box-containing protein